MKHRHAWRRGAFALAAHSAVGQADRRSAPTTQRKLHKIHGQSTRIQSPPALDHRAHSIGGFTPSAPITTAAASEPSFFITMKTLRPTASWSAGALSKATTVALVGMVIVCSPPL